MLTIFSIKLSVLSLFSFAIVIDLPLPLEALALGCHQSSKDRSTLKVKIRQVLRPVSVYDVSNALMSRYLAKAQLS